MDSAPLVEEVCPTEDVLEALLNHLVVPVLRLKPNSRESPSFYDHQVVAKQMHAVVLMYNYYQRKHHPAVEILGFESFCKLAVILKPSLMAYMKIMHQSNYTELDDLENHLSITEKAIMNACDICSALFSSKEVPDAKGWPVSKVAVLLVDSRRENCLLLFSSVTHGVWSVIEKDLNVSSEDSGVTIKNKHISKRKRNPKSFLTDVSNTDETGLRQLALSAVKEAAGITQTDLMVLESQVVYSLSKEKTAARFYIVQCNQLINQDLQVPLNDVLESMQNPLVKRSSSGWTLTPVVDYFHVLPYAGILSDWLSREVLSDSLQDVRVEVEFVREKSSPWMENSCNDEILEGKSVSHQNHVVPDQTNNRATDGDSRSRKQKDYFRCPMTCLPPSVNEPEDVDADNSSLVCSQNKESTSEDFHKYASRCGANAKAEMVDSKMMPWKQDDTENISNTIISDHDGRQGGNLAALHSQVNSKYLRNLEATLDSDEKALSQTALGVLLRVREKLSHQLRDLQDEIALCDKDIQKIEEGGDSHLVLKVVETQDTTDKTYEDQGSPLSMKKRLSEATLTSQNPCQDLDDICCKNKWTLPTYGVLSIDGGFQAKVTVKGIDFEYSDGSDLHHCPRMARKAVAAKMISKLRSLEGQR